MLLKNTQSNDRNLFEIKNNRIYDESTSLSFENVCFNNRFLVKNV
jgi:hypothetical protein